MAEKPEQDDDLAPTSTARTEMEEPQEGDNRGDDRTEKQNIPNKLAENNDRNTNEIVRATTEDSKENSNRSTEEISASERKKAAAAVGNTQTTPMASVIPHQEQQQQQQQIPISIQPAYNYNFPPTMGFMQNFMPAPSYLTGQASLNPSRYTDAAYIADPVPDMRRNRGGVTEPFPEKLHKMLEATDKEGKGDIVGFFSHGRAFAIHQPRKFVSDIMPRFFNQSRLTSFQRQLNLYGFKRISQYVVCIIELFLSCDLPRRHISNFVSSVCSCFFCVNRGPDNGGKSRESRFVNAFFTPLLLLNNTPFLFFFSRLLP